jgi:hypothetical protein
LPCSTRFEFVSQTDWQSARAVWIQFASRGPAKQQPPKARRSQSAAELPLPSPAIRRPNALRLPGLVAGLRKGDRGETPPADRCAQPSRLGTRIVNTKSQQETTRLKFDKLFIS